MNSMSLYERQAVQVGGMNVCLCTLAHCLHCEETLAMAREDYVKTVGVYVSVFVLDDLCESQLQEGRD